jgi:mannose-6-phosphate isomerase
MRPFVLPPNGVPRFYKGGPAIAALRGTEPMGDRVPEDWVGSMTTVFGQDRLGLSRLSDGRVLRDVAAADPIGFFGPDHTEERGADPALLVKLLDAGERLPVHVHPDDAFAGEKLGSRYGKTEAWVIIGTAESAATVAVGFRDEVDVNTLECWVRDQDRPAMIEALNPIEVRAGDAIFVPAGVPHAIGEGVLLIELQEPSDLSVLLEWEGFAADGDASLGLGWEVALRCVDRSRRDPATIRGSRVQPGTGPGSLLPAGADRFFRAEWIDASPSAELERGFALLVLVEGTARLHSGDGEPISAGRGDALLLPWAAGACRLEGPATAIACRPPAPGAGGGA